MKHLFILIFVCIVMSCKQDAPNSSNTNIETRNAESVQKSNSESSSDALTVESLKPSPPTQILNSEFIPSFVKYLESSYCESKNKKGTECYSMHEAAVKSDFLAKLPITLNFPYDGSFDWSGLLDQKGFSQYWSNKCGFMNEQTGDVITYYCLNISGATRPWLDSLAQTNTLVKEFTDFYYNTQAIVPNYQSSFILNNVNNLDYDNIDHRAFYWMYHLALYEESIAATKTKDWK